MADPQRDVHEALEALDTEQDPETRRAIEEYIDNALDQIDMYTGDAEPEYTGIRTQQMKALAL